MCKELGESGENIDNDIARLVAKGLDPLIQQALDVVRVIGNEAVHSGEIDIDDNRDTALQLFNLINNNESNDQSAKAGKNALRKTARKEAKRH